MFSEISFLKHPGKYNHPNELRLLDICHGPRYYKEMVLYLVFEHIEKDLSTFLEHCPPPKKDEGHYVAIA